MPVTAATYSREGKWLTGAAKDGSIKFWNAAGPYFRPTMGSHVSNLDLMTLYLHLGVTIIH
jgi:WD40 repeat protein